MVFKRTEDNLYSLLFDSYKEDYLKDLMDDRLREYKNTPESYVPIYINKYKASNDTKYASFKERNKAKSKASKSVQRDLLESSSPVLSELLNAFINEGFDVSPDRTITKFTNKRTK